MVKCSLKKLLQVRIVTCIAITCCIIVIYQFFAFYGSYNYPHIPEEELQSELHRETNPLLVKNANVECKYDEILTSTKSLDSTEVDRKYNDFQPLGIANGSYVPKHCNPAFSVAILVTYRNRQQQMEVFLPYMHNFLRKQNIHYKIYLIEQQDEKPWNKGLLYNIGARRAIQDKFPCLILHDVDLLPLDSSNLYACTRRPRHMSASIDKFRFVLPYGWLVGGALAIRAADYVAVDGFSNRFQGWGGEDDDFYERLEARKLQVVRYPRSMSRYSMLRHRPERASAARHRVLAANRAARRARAGDKDGYSAAPPRALALTNHRLFTLLAVKL